MSAPSQIRELQVIGVTADGSISSPLQRYSFENGLPAELQNVCRVDTRLVCRNVPTSATQAGSYAFQFTLLSRAGQNTTKQTPFIRIQQPPQLRSFQIDGKDIGQTPTLQFEISPNGEPKTIALSWQVEASPGTRVELLPAPGSVPVQGSINYTISSTPGQQTLTLRITDPSGQQMTRSLILETVAPPPAQTPIFPSPIPQAKPSPTPFLPSKPPAKPSAEQSGPIK